jgi:hypothetical protein
MFVADKEQEQLRYRSLSDETFESTRVGVVLEQTRSFVGYGKFKIVEVLVARYPYCSVHYKFLARLHCEWIRGSDKVARFWGAVPHIDLRILSLS